MKTLYWKLAWHGIYKNQKIYLPFLLTSIGITMMYYIVSYLTYSKAIYEMHGGQEMQMILSWGTGVVAIFAAIFLFYMNSFLMRRRKTEFGLYNILGMGTSLAFYAGRMACCLERPWLAVWGWVFCCRSSRN